MRENFIAAIGALTLDMKLFFSSLFGNSVFLSFIGGLSLAILIIGFVMSKNPAHIPLMLRYSSMESFEKISKRNKKGTYEGSYSSFLKMYAQIRMLFMIGFISFCVMVTTTVLVG